MQVQAVARSIAGVGHDRSVARALSVLPVRDRSEIRRFVDVAYHVHHEEPRWIPPLRSDVTARVRFRRNPFWRRAGGRLFVARRGQQMVGRISVHLDAVEEADRSVASFGFFECEDDAVTAQALVDAARTFAAAEGAGAMVGPASFTPLEEASFLSPWHPPYYRGLLERAGGRFDAELATVHVPLDEFDVEGADVAPPRVSAAERAVIERAGDLNALAPDSPVTWRPTVAEAKARVRRLRPLVDRELLVLDDDGVVIAVPDLNEVLAKVRDGLGVVNAARVLTEARRARSGAVVAMLAGDAPALVGRAARRGAGAGYERLEFTAVEGSVAHRTGEEMDGRVVRRYATFRFPIADG